MYVNLRIESTDKKVEAFHQIFSDELPDDEKWEVLRGIGFKDTEMKIETSYSDGTGVWDDEAIDTDVLESEDHVKEYEHEILSSCNEDDYVKFIELSSKYIKGKFNVSIWHEDDPDCIDEYTFENGKGDYSFDENTSD